MNEELEKRDLTIHVDPIMLMILIQSIKNNQDGLLKNIQDTLGITLAGLEMLKEVITELDEVAKKYVAIQVQKFK